MIHLAPYMGWSGEETLSAQANQTNSVDRRVQGFRCPESTYNPTGNEINSGHYGMNLVLTSGYPTTNLALYPSGQQYPNLWAQRRRLNTLKTSHNLVYLVSDLTNYSAYTASFATVDATLTHPTRRRGHGVIANILFVDGHVEALSRGMKKDLWFLDGENEGWF
jgi:prepilin-type processing-associated H-X9-DG protein